ncbi:MAG: prephenate dehydrogenase/arogenate dehydrogenase family protein [bacterium]
MQITIIGLGLIGGSIGLKLKSLGRADLKIVGVPRREETIHQAKTLGAIDEGTTDPKAGVSQADIVFIATPINLVIPILEEIAAALKPNAIVTDVASSKEGIVLQAAKLMPKGAFFVGGHPLAGKETVKLESAEIDLFVNKVWALTPNSKTSKKALTAVSKLAILLGGVPVELDPKLHDLAVAGISHMPLAVAVALVDAVSSAKNGKEQMMKLAASGFRDTTRIASGDPILGVDMFVTNKKAVLKMIGAFKKSLSGLEKLIKEGDPQKIEHELEKVKAFRDSIESLS